MEELVPRETGREAMLERRRQRGEYSRREGARGVGGEGMEDVDDDVLMGGGQGELEKEKNKKRRGDERRQAEHVAKRDEYEQREKARMKAMLESIGMADRYPLK